MSEQVAFEFSEERCVRPSPVLRSLLRPNPLEVIERLALAEHYEVERTTADRLHLLVPGFWRDHDVSFAWRRDEELLNVAVVFDGRVLAGMGEPITRLLCLLNSELRAGHFEYWPQGRSLIYRYTASLAGGAELRIEQAMAMVATALDASETGHPAFQYVIWAGKTPEDAMDRVKDDLAGIS